MQEFEEKLLNWGELFKIKNIQFRSLRKSKPIVENVKEVNRNILSNVILNIATPS